MRTRRCTSLAIIGPRERGSTRAGRVCAASQSARATVRSWPGADQLSADNFAAMVHIIAKHTSVLARVGLGRDTPADRRFLASIDAMIASEPST